jgi:GntR family transcriptional regulator
MIDKNSPLPIYYQLEENIKHLIESGQILPGDSILSEREMSEKYKISRMTVRQAITNLVNKGYLIREKGKGTFVSDKKFEQNLHGLTSFSEDMLSRGLTPGNQILSFEKTNAEPDIQKKLSLNENDLIYQIRRVRLANNQPMALETSFLSVDLVPGLNPEILEQSLYQYIEDELKLNIGHATQTIESSIVNKEEIKYLNLKKGDPVLLMERETYLNDGTPLELVKSSYRADKYRFSIDIVRGRN